MPELPAVITWMTEIAEALAMLGEERYAKRIAAAIYARERKSPLQSTNELADLVIATVPANYERGRLHPATRTFQAFRIYANDELGNLHRILEALPEVLERRRWYRRSG